MAKLEKGEKKVESERIQRGLRKNPKVKAKTGNKTKSDEKCSCNSRLTEIRKGNKTTVDQMEYD